MAKTSAANLTAQGAWMYGNASGDQFAKEDLQNLGKNADLHDHDETIVGHGLPPKIRTFNGTTAGDTACLAATDNAVATVSVTGGGSRGYFVTGHCTFLDTSASSNDVTVKILDQANNIVAQGTQTCTASKTVNVAVTALWSPAASGTWTLVCNPVGTGTAKGTKNNFQLIRYT
jgi:hypothetical protein